MTRILWQSRSKGQPTTRTTSEEGRVPAHMEVLGSTTPGTGSRRRR